MSGEIVRLLVKLGRDAEYVIRDLEAIRDELSAGGESLTPDQYQTVSESLIPIGLIGADLVDDLERSEAEAE